VIFDPFATCPKFLAFLEKILPDPAVRRYVQVVLGYACTGNTDIQEYWMLQGEGGNGKGTLLHVIDLILGPYLRVGPKTLIQQKDNASEPHPTQTAFITGSRLLLFSELERGANLCVGFLKAVTGETKLDGRECHKDWFTFAPTCKTIIETNEVPHINDTSHAMKRRSVVIPFTQKFEGPAVDTSLRKQLSEELSGVFNWLLDGVKGYYAGELKHKPAAVVEASAALWKSADLYSAWINECCVRSTPEAPCKMPRDVLFDAFIKWAKRVAPNKSFDRPYWVRKLGEHGVRWTKKSDQTVVLPIRLKTDAELELERTAAEYWEEAEPPQPQRSVNRYDLSPDVGPPPERKPPAFETSPTTQTKLRRLQ
jgi:putative DNA primase/helicase